MWLLFRGKGSRWSSVHKHGETAASASRRALATALWAVASSSMDGVGASSLRGDEHSSRVCYWKPTAVLHLFSKPEELQAGVQTSHSSMNRTLPPGKQRNVWGRFLLNSGSVLQICPQMGTNLQHKPLWFVHQCFYDSINCMVFGLFRLIKVTSSF